MPSPKGRSYGGRGRGHGGKSNAASGKQSTHRRADRASVVHLSQAQQEQVSQLLAAAGPTQAWSGGANQDSCCKYCRLI